MKKVLISKLIEKAKKARLNAYSPYSKFSVGAAIMADDGTIFTGCNIENQSFGLSICAERVAIFKAISEGHRKFKALAIVVDTENPCSPCGACRQVLAEFSMEMDIIMANLQNKIEIKKVKELLPYIFQGLIKKDQ